MSKLDEQIQGLKYQYQVWKETEEDLWSKSNIESSSTIVDIGCGPGFSSLELARRFGNEKKSILLTPMVTFFRSLKTNQKIKKLKILKL